MVWHYHRSVASGGAHHWINEVLLTMAKRIERGMGWIPDIPDPRDLRAGARKPKKKEIAALPPSVELWTPPIIDQRSTSSCTGFASAKLFELMLNLLGRPTFQPSPLFNYWYGRHVARRGWENVDEGAMPRDVMQSMISNGVVPETDWP